MHQNLAATAAAEAGSTVSNGLNAVCASLSSNGWRAGIICSCSSCQHPAASKHKKLMLQTCSSKGYVHVQGTIERAMAQLGAYRTDLEERVVALFDQAGAAGDLRTMAGCCIIMTDCQRGAQMLAEVRWSLHAQQGSYSLL